MSMWEVFEMKDGTKVKFYSWLVPDGIIVQAEKSDLTDAQMDAFDSEIRSERDVVKLIFV